jgi:hypothetical protein
MKESQTETREEKQDRILADAVEMIRIICEHRAKPATDKHLQLYLRDNSWIAARIGRLYETIQESGLSPLDNASLKHDLTAFVIGYDFTTAATWVVRDHLPCKAKVRRETHADCFNSAIRLNSRGENFKFREAWAIIAKMSESPFPAARMDAKAHEILAAD